MSFSYQSSLVSLNVVEVNETSSYPATTMFISVITTTQRAAPRVIKQAARRLTQIGRVTEYSSKNIIVGYSLGLVLYFRIKGSKSVRLQWEHMAQFMALCSWSDIFGIRFMVVIVSPPFYINCMNLKRDLPHG
jgi:hypothetical protein